MNWFLRLPWWGKTILIVVVLAVVLGPFLEEPEPDDAVRPESAASSTEATQSESDDADPTLAVEETSTTTAPLEETTSATEDTVSSVRGRSLCRFEKLDVHRRIVCHSGMATHC